MIASLYRPLMIGLLPIALIACISPGPTVADEGAAVPLGVDLGGSGPVAASPQPHALTRTALAAELHPQHMSEMQMAHAGHNDAHGTGTVNSVDPAEHKVKVTQAVIVPVIHGYPRLSLTK